ncbi:MAG: hypothetical protein IT379_23115 [Deltaproteobacteria bacterium]|nr:hypothetical protein [Deltaproteobacteria bacterium]
MAEYPGPITTALFASSGPLSSALSSVGSSGPTRKGVSECPLTKWGVTEITMTCGSKTSTSYDDPDHAEVPGGRGGRFFFAPIEEKVEIKWKLHNPDNATTLTLALYRSGSGAPIWTRTLDAEAAKAEKLDEEWDGSFPGSEWASFPSHLVTVEHSPYMLKATAGDNAAEGLVERWTYLDVIIDKIELFWGGKALLPVGAPNGVDGLYSAQTALDERAINDELVTKKRGDDTLDPAATYDVVLRCNQFTSYVYDMDDGHSMVRNPLWKSHRKQWGDGPRIPLVAKIHIAKAAGGAVHGGDAAKAIGGTKFLWDWESKDEIAALGTLGLNGSVETFLTDSLDYLRNAGTGPPGSTNCHTDHAGKRGGADAVFLRLNALSTEQAACGTRVWAAHAKAILTGTHAGCVGVMFQPSRMGLDTYAVSVYAQPDGGAGGAAALDVVSPASDLVRDYGPLPRAKSGTFQTLRKVRVRYVRKSNAVQTAVLATIATEYRKAGVVIDWGATQAADERTLATDYHTWFGQIIAAPGNRAPKVTSHGTWFEATDQLQAGTGGDVSYAFVAAGWDLASRKVKVDSIREYVQKDRVFNGTKKAYDRWLTTHAATDDHQYLLPFYDGLSTKKKAKVDTIITRRMAAAGLSTKATYESDVEGAAVQLTQQVAEKLLLAINEHGMVILHSEAPVGYRQIDGSVVVPPSGQGGISPSGSSQWNGRGSVHMVFLPQTPSTNPAAKYSTPVTAVIAHEMGHNLFLNHAPDAPSSSKSLHDAADKKCILNYDQTSDHLCGYCHLKLRGWATVGANDHVTKTGPIDGDGHVKLWSDSTKNKNP